MRTNFICQLKGHETNAFDGYNCERCEAAYDGSPAWGGSLWWRLTWRVRGVLGLPPFTYRSTLWHLRQWIKPCVDCGKRFGRHDETKEHIPF